MLERAPSDWNQGPSLLESILCHKWLVILAALLGALVAYGWSSRQPVRYEGVIEVFLSPVPGGDQGNQRTADEAARDVRTQAELLTSPAVLERAASLSRTKITRKQLEKRLTVDPAQDADLITIRVMDATPKGAARLADSVARAYREVRAERAQDAADQAKAGLDRSLKKLDADLDLIIGQLRTDPNNRRLQAERRAALEQLNSAAVRRQQIAFDADLAAGSQVSPQERAPIPDEPAEPRPVRTAIIGMMLGLALGAALAWWLTWRRLATRLGKQPAPVAEVGSIEPNEPRAQPATLSRGLRRLRDRPVVMRVKSAADGNGSMGGIADFERLTTSIEQVFDSLKGVRQRLYEQNVPQMMAEEIARRFPVDIVVLLLENSDGLLQVTGGVGLTAAERRMSTHQDLMQTAFAGGPRLVKEEERAQWAEMGIPFSRADPLILVPLIHEDVTFGLLLAGQQQRGPVPPSLDEQDIQDIVACAKDIIPYLRAWLLLRSLKLRLSILQ
jgi:hypothetical protein